MSDAWSNAPLLKSISSSMNVRSRHFFMLFIRLRPCSLVLHKIQSNRSEIDRGGATEQSKNPTVFSIGTSTGRRGDFTRGIRSSEVVIDSSSIPPRRAPSEKQTGDEQRAHR